MRRSIFRPILLGASFAVPLLLAGCGGDEGVPQSFPPLRYNYLAPISLNVANIQTDVRYVPQQGGSNLDATSPEAPLQALEQMVQDRLVAGGGSGTATVTINAASLNQVNDTVVGNISLRLSVTSADGRQRGYTDANVTRTRTMPDNTSPDALRAFLYAMTQDLVNAENVELEYQIRQNLAGWLVGGASAVIGGPAAPTPVQAVPLGGPGDTSLAPPAPLTPTTGVVTPMAAPAGTTSGIVTPMAAPAPTPTMPGGALGLPEGNPVPASQDFSAPAATSAVPGAPVPLTPAVPATAASPGTPAPGVLGTMPVSPGATAATPAPAAPAMTSTTTKTVTKPAASSSSSSNSALPPLPAGITP